MFMFVITNQQQSAVCQKPRADGDAITMFTGQEPRGFWLFVIRNPHARRGVQKSLKLWG